METVAEIERIKSLGDAAELIHDTVAPSEIELTPYVGLEHIQEGTLQLSGHGWSNQVNSAKTRFKRGDILFGKLRPYFRKVIRAPFDGVCSTDIWVIRAKEGIEQGYLYYWMASEDFVDAVSSASEGTKMPRAKWEYASQFTRVVPPLAEQRRIAHILGTLDDKIELNRRMNATLEAIARAIFKSWFVDFDPVRAKAAGGPSGLPPALEALFPSRFVDSDLGEIPEGWEVVKMQEVVTPLLGGTPSRKVNNYWKDGTISWINSGEVNKFRIIAPTEKITQEGLENSSTKLTPPRTVVIAITGATLGQVSLVEIETAFNQSIVAIPGTENLPSEYLYLWVKSNIDIITSWQTGGAQQHINKGNVGDSDLLIPTPEVTRAFYRKSSQWFDLIASNEFEINELARVRDSLLPKLMKSGVRRISLL